MSHFYSSIESKNTTHTKCGNKKDGMSAHIRGWNIGVLVNLVYDEETGKDKVYIYLTGGSNSPDIKIPIRELIEGGD